MSRTRSGDKLTTHTQSLLLNFSARFTKVYLQDSLQYLCIAPIDHSFECGSCWPCRISLYFQQVRSEAFLEEVVRTITVIA